MGKEKEIKVVVFALSLLYVTPSYVELQRSYQFARVLSHDQDENWVWRSEASILKTLRLVDFDRRYRVDLKICIDPIEDEDTVSIYVDDIRYANDGPNDFIFVSFEGKDWDVFSTHERWAHGHEWNIFRNTGRVNSTKFLRKGEYILSVSVLTDQWGLELDKISIIAEYQKLDSSLFCGGRLVDTYDDTFTHFVYHGYG